MPTTAAPDAPLVAKFAYSELGIAFIRAARRVKLGIAFILAGRLRFRGMQMEA